MGLAGTVSACTNLQYRARPDAVGAIIVAREAMRVAIYARVSTGEQSPEQQFRELRDDAERRSFVIYRECVEKATDDVRCRCPLPSRSISTRCAALRRACVNFWTESLPWSYPPGKAHHPHGPIGKFDPLVRALRLLPRGSISTRTCPSCPPYWTARSPYNRG